MKTTKDQREQFISGFDNLNQKDVIDLTDDLDSLEKRAAWLEGRLDRCKVAFSEMEKRHWDWDVAHGEAFLKRLQTYRGEVFALLADLERGPEEAIKSAESIAEGK